MRLSALLVSEEKRTESSEFCGVARGASGTEDVGFDGVQSEVATGMYICLSTCCEGPIGSRRLSDRRVTILARDTEIVAEDEAGFVIDRIDGRVGIRVGESPCAGSDIEPADDPVQVGDRNGQVDVAGLQDCQNGCQ